MTKHMDIKQDLMFIILSLILWSMVVMTGKGLLFLQGLIDSGYKTVYYCTKCAKPATRFVTYAINPYYDKSDTRDVPYCDDCSPLERVSIRRFGQSNKQMLDDFYFIAIFISFFIALHFQLKIKNRLLPSTAGKSITFILILGFIIWKNFSN